MIMKLILVMFSVGVITAELASAVELNESGSPENTAATIEQRVFEAPPAKHTNIDVKEVVEQRYYVRKEQYSVII